MPPSRSLQAFTPEQRKKAHALLATKVAFMMGRKFEEGDWTEVYCKAKSIPVQGWSNLNIDIMHAGLGVEHKMLCYRSNADLAEACGQTFMHPAATRSIRVPDLDSKPDEAMHDIFTQYAELIRERTTRIQATAPRGTRADMRTGWLIWQESLRQFLYFEERMKAPDPSRFYAEWHESGGGARKTSKNLWVFDKRTGQKRYSVTTSAGAKIQPYFDVPPPDDPNICLFTVIGEAIDTGTVRVWLSAATLRDLKRIAGSSDAEKLSALILRELRGAVAQEAAVTVTAQTAESVLLSAEAYERITATFPGVNDDHAFQLFIQYMSGRK